jgi:hypothetical protein
MTSTSAAYTMDHASIAARALASSALLAPRSTENQGGMSTLQRLLDSANSANTPVARGQAYAALDAETGSRGATDALVGGAGQAAPAGKTPVPTEPKYDDSSLYGAGGPSGNDIEQNTYGDCYYVATLAAVANENPNAIRNAISYDEKTQSFNVTLYDANGQPQVQNVTQAEIDANIATGGGSRRDNGLANAPIWPDVMEVAYAKQLDSNHAEGYADLADGGWPKDAMRAITGDEGHSVRYDEGFFESRGHAMDEVGNQISDALRDGKPVTAWSVPESDSRSLWGKLRGHANPQDGLADNHVYTVTSAYKDSQGNWQIVMRNPWANNNLGTLSEGYDTSSAFITVPLDRLVRTGGLEEFRVGN